MVTICRPRRQSGLIEALKANISPSLINHRYRLRLPNQAQHLAAFDDVVRPALKAETAIPLDTMNAVNDRWKSLWRSVPEAQEEGMDSLQLRANSGRLSPQATSISLRYIPGFSMPTAKEAMTIAVAHHQAGRLKEAEEIYREILVVAPNHVDALHLLGVVALQTGRHKAAVDHITRAIRLNGTEASFHNNLGETYRSLPRKLPEAEGPAAVARSNSRPITQKAHYNLGLILATAGRHEEAVSHFRRTAELSPSDGDAPCFLGISLAALRRSDEALDSLRRAVDLKPDNARAHLHLGHTLRRRRQFEESVASYRRAAQLTPDDPAIHFRLGQVLKAASASLDEAIASFRRSAGTEAR